MYLLVVGAGPTHLEDAMTEPTVPPRGPGRSPITWTVVGVLLAIGVAGTLIVPIYARATPKAGAFPFFYWYQLLWVPLVAILSFVCYLLVRRTGRASRTEGRRDEQR
jgi:membrane protein implicated in regulation of membrane protease activity